MRLSVAVLPLAVLLAGGARLVKKQRQRLAKALQGPLDEESLKDKFRDVAASDVAVEGLLCLGQVRKDNYRQQLKECSKQVLGQGVGELLSLINPLLGAGFAVFSGLLQGGSDEFQLIDELREEVKTMIRGNLTDFSKQLDEKELSVMRLEIAEAVVPTRDRSCAVARAAAAIVKAPYQLFNTGCLEKDEPECAAWQTNGLGSSRALVYEFKYMELAIDFAFEIGYDPAFACSFRRVVKQLKVGSKALSKHAARWNNFRSDRRRGKDRTPWENREAGLTRPDVYKGNAFSIICNTDCIVAKSMKDKWTNESFGLKLRGRNVEKKVYSCFGRKDCNRKKDSAFEDQMVEYNTRKNMINKECGKFLKQAKQIETVVDNLARMPSFTSDVLLCKCSR